MRVFICYSTRDSKFVLQVATLLKPNFDEVFYYEGNPDTSVGFQVTIDKAMQRCDHLLVFVGSDFSKWQQGEVQTASAKENLNACTIFIHQPPDGKYPEVPAGLGFFTGRYRILANPKDENAATQTAWKIMQAFEIPFHPDGLPFDPNLFSYEKHIIDFFTKMIRLGEQAFPLNHTKKTVDPKDEGNKIRQKILSGCPVEWPSVTYWAGDGKSDPPDASYVVAAALSQYHKYDKASCMINNKLYFPEARTRQNFYFPTSRNALHVAILVAGGIAPGINAVIDGIVQRHWLDANRRNYNVSIYGIKNGVSSIELKDDLPGRILDEALVFLAPSETTQANGPQWEFSAIHAREGGSIIGTSRVDDLIKNRGLLAKVVQALLGRGINILYVIGGDGSMKLAHALWHYANTNNGLPSTKKLSIVAIPKTMDNDILWMWQSFGFLSAVEKAREILTILDTEIKSNPRLCILQLFGSDSGFVVSHTVAASGSDQCDAALIPEVKFSLRGLAHYLKEQMYERKKTNSSAIVPSGFVVMSETAIPTDAICYTDEAGKIPKDLASDWDFIKRKIDPDDLYLAPPPKKINSSAKEEEAIYQKINLSAEEKEAIYEFHRMRRRGERIQGQTSDTLRSAGLKIVSRGLQKLLILPDPELDKQYQEQPDWEKLRIVTNEPRHVLRSIAPTCSDIIMGQRLGTLAVDNALAGYTDFMISQWLTEFVLVPLPLVVLGRKRIPMQGMFWNSVLAKTGQPRDLDTVGDLPNRAEP